MTLHNPIFFWTVTTSLVDRGVKNQYFSFSYNFQGKLSKRPGAPHFWPVLLHTPFRLPNARSAAVLAHSLSRLPTGHAGWSPRLRKMSAPEAPSGYTSSCAVIYCPESGCRTIIGSNRLLGVEKNTQISECQIFTRPRSSLITKLFVKLKVMQKNSDQFFLVYACIFLKLV